MKNDVSEFIQNEIKQKLNLYIKEEDQAFVYKMIIVILEKETEFLNSNTHKNNKDNIEGKIWDFGESFSTSDSQSVCSAGKSGDSLVTFSDVNIISHKPSK